MSVGGGGAILMVVLVVHGVYFDQRHGFAPGPETVMPRCLAGERGQSKSRA